MDGHSQKWTADLTPAQTGRELTLKTYEVSVAATRSAGGKIGSCEVETGLNFELSESILSGGSSGLFRQHFSPNAQSVFFRFKNW